MKVFTLTYSLVVALSLPALGQDHAILRSEISTKEKQLAEIQKELHELRSKLSSPVTGTYVVKTGETLHSIARRHKVSISDVMQWNKITDPTKLGVGEIIIVSGPSESVEHPSTTSSAPTAKASDYVVAKGDTFYSIARRHKMTLAQLRAINPDVSTHLLSVGMKLRVSGKVSTAPSSTTKKPLMVVEETESKKSTPKPSAQATTSKKTTKPTQTDNNKPAPNQLEKLPEPPVIKERPTSLANKSIILTDVITFEAFASKHGTSTKHLNALNGWNLPKSTVLAGGSEILVPN